MGMIITSRCFEQATGNRPQGLDTDPGISGLIQVRTLGKEERGKTGGKIATLFGFIVSDWIRF
jgi:hypothetical protein